MNRLIMLIAVILGMSVNSAFAQNETSGIRTISFWYDFKNPANETGSITESTSGPDDPSYLKLHREGKDVILSLINFEPALPYNQMVACGGSVSIWKNTISFDSHVGTFQLGCEVDTEKIYRFDLKINLGEIPDTDLVLLLDVNASKKFSYNGKISLQNEFLLSSNVLTKLTSIISQNKEWVYYNNVLNGEQDKPLYRIRCAGGKNNWYDVWLYDSPVFDQKSALLIMSEIDVYEDFRVKGYMENVEIPSTFWAAGLPQSTYNPYAIKAKNDPWGLKLVDSQCGPALMTVSNCEGTDEAPWKRYWWDFLNDLQMPMYVKDYGFKSENNTIEAVNLCENPDGSGYSAQWVLGIGPVGDNVASNFVYPLYNLPEGCEPTRLLYVRDFETNEVLWGDPTLDKYYLGVGEVEVEDTDTGYTVYTSNGICVLRNGEKSQYDSLPAGLYIVNGEKVIKK